MLLQVAWLLQLSGIEFAAPKEYDAANDVCSSILSALRKLGFSAPSYQATKLSHGYGREVRAAKQLAVNGFGWQFTLLVRRSTYYALLT